MHHDDHTSEDNDVNSEVNELSSNYGGKNGQTLAMRVVEAVATETGTDPLEMQPLYDAIDSDVLKKILDSTSESALQTLHGHITFQFEMCDVTVFPDGRITVLQQDPD